MKPEFRIEELARSAGTTVRNVRAYRDRGLLPAPRREGRVAYYNNAHLGRLRLIAGMLERGYSLANIAELLEAWEQGQEIGDLLGLEAVLAGPWHEDAESSINRSDLDGLFGADVAPLVIESGVRLGVLSADPHDDDRLVVNQPRTLEAGAELLRAGVPIDVVLDLAGQLHEDVERIAGRFVDVVVNHVLDPAATRPDPRDVPRIAEVVARLRPLALKVVAAELGHALEHRVHDHLGEKVAQLLAEREADIEAS
jgi:DNA-binding transcriptional MerR regulator